MDTLGESFDDYVDKCLEETLPIQDAFMQLYDIDSYENWFYDHGTGAFHFKSDSGKNLYFKYTDVGSFSTKTNTWNWSWANKYTPAYVCRRLEKVKAFGEANSFVDLTQGLIEGDEYTGWAMTAITAKQLSAIGMYRVPHEHLFIYFIFNNELTQDEFDSLEDRYIECDNHGASRVAFVCQHLIGKNKVGFHEAFETDPSIEPDDDFQAWCDECKIARQKEGEWNDVSMAVAQIKVVCDQCYFEIKNINLNDA